MEVDLVAQDLSEDDNYSIDEYNEDDLNFEGERCGICMDVVIDRGVLDCCQHWFCFTCIDNWATITNLCPLCQNEFQMITCVPVYDTIGSTKTDEDTNPSDDSWTVDGRNSFPSYYIDENAVVCLEDGCTIRNGLAAVGEDSNLDTSIACDLCDKWYHAYCVEFDTETSCEESWLCPRCLVLEAPEKSDMTPGSGLSKELRHDASGQCVVGSDLVGKVLVSVADVGETALVVSKVEGDKMNEESVGDPSSIDLCADIVVDTVLSDSTTNLSRLELLPHSGSTVEPNLGSEGLGLSLLQNTFAPSTSSSNLIESTHLMSNIDEKSTGELRLLDGLQTRSRELFAESSNDTLLEAGLDLHLAFSNPSSAAHTPSTQPAVDLTINETEFFSDPVQLHDAIKKHLPLVDMVMEDKKEIIPAPKIPSDTRENGAASVKRKSSDNRDRDPGKRKVDNGAKLSVKRVKTEEKNQHSQSKVHAEQSKLKSSNAVSDSTKVTKVVITRHLSQKKSAVDSVDIVQERGRNHPTQLASAGAGTSSKERGSASGLRVKKIMRSANNDENTSSVVQTLRQEIRDAVRNKSSREVGESHFDPKLLAAFRAVVAGQTAETKRNPVNLKAKKLLLQKGKVRENLTKKIYSTGGKRKRAWVRDCDIEFWKYRCTQVSKPEKVQTLKSVLDLLNSDSGYNAECEKDDRTKDAFLTRLYLADASVVPRKSDIKPVSGHDSVLSEQSKELSQRAGFPSSRNICDSNSLKNEPVLKHEGSSHKIFTFKGSSLSTTPGTSKVTSQKKLAGMSDDIKSDKRKWALELLARKTAVVGKNSKHEKEDTAMLKGNYPLLAQLPKDMRPELAPTRHNKIPASVRQAQLYRLAEHLIKKANLPVIRRAAETELAIADAINIEKEIANRSNSKPVYVNLCSQEIRRKNISASIELNPSSASETIGKANESGDHSKDMQGDDALRAAGLLSDSPPGSPLQHMDDVKGDNGLSENIEDDGPDNVFEVESQPDLDIYGDFDYSLEDDDLIGASTLKISRPQTEDPKIKVLLSTLIKPESLNVLQGGVACERSGVEASGSPSLSSKDSSAVDVCTESDVQDHTKDGDEEQCLAECDIQELYGPDKEPLIRKYPETASIIPREPLLNNENPGHVVDNEHMEIRKEDSASNIKDKEDAASHSKRSENSSDMEIRKEDSASNIKHKEDAASHSKRSENSSDKEKASTSETSKTETVSKKVEAYIKEHIRPLCKSGVITVDQYRWAVGRTTEKVMKYHSKDKNANFLIKEGEKVKKLAEQYVEAAQQNSKDH